MRQGFTLAELLIALAILGVIATFTIPKVLQSQQDGKYKAIAKEALATVSQAYSAYKLNTAPTALTTGDALTPFINYVKLETVNPMDGTPDTANSPASVNCATTFRCLRLHNGAALIYDPAVPFNGSATTNALSFAIDPDGKFSGNRDTLAFFLYFNERHTTAGSCLDNTRFAGVTFNPDPANDPAWFSWN